MSCRAMRTASARSLRITKRRWSLQVIVPFAIVRGPGLRLYSCCPSRPRMARQTAHENRSGILVPPAARHVGLSWPPVPIGLVGDEPPVLVPIDADGSGSFDRGAPVSAAHGFPAASAVVP